MKVQSVEKAMKILNVLLKKSPMTLTQISEVLSYPKSTVHALISTMRDFGIIEQKEDGRYVLGIHLYELGCAAASSWDISAIVHSYLEKLSEETGSTSFVSILDKSEAMTFDRHIASVSLQIVSDQGSRFPLHATCQGKILLSSMSDENIKTYVRNHMLYQYTAHTIVNEEKLLEEIHKVREQGYAIEDGEYRMGLRAVAAPIKDSKGQIKYALGTLGIFRKVFTEEFIHATECTVKYANIISMEIAKKIGPKIF